jgi:23S rRNA pseudouridine1911/1915/1917 synthase
MSSDHKRERTRGTKKETRLTAERSAELMAFLMEKLPGQSRNNIKSLLTHRQVKVEGQVVSQYNHLLKPGQEVLVNWALVRDKEAEKSFRIIYEDADIIVIDKPAGLLTIATDAEKERTAYHQLTDYVQIQNPDQRIFIVHRLDRDTSGVMLFARNEAVKKMFQDNWKELMTERAYIAVVEGRLDKKEGTVKSWLLETKTKLMYSSARPGAGLEAITHYKVLMDSSRYSLLEIRLETGRKNQIRVHMQDMGHSIIGDKKYGAKTNPIGRLGLHASILAFRHPVTHEVMRFETEVPKKFSRLLK